VRSGGGVVRTASRIREFPQLLAGRKTLEEVRAGIHHRSHQPQPLQQHKNLGKGKSNPLIAPRRSASRQLPRDRNFIQISSRETFARSE